MLIRCEECTNEVSDKAKNCPGCGAPITAGGVLRDRLLTAILAILLGVIGAHRFYLGQMAFGILYIVLFIIFAPIPIILGIFDGIGFLVMTDAEFHKKYDKK